MFLTHTQLIAALAAFDEARKSFDCPAPRHDAEGETEPPDGPAYGNHNAAYLEIDPETLELRCGACAGTQSDLATPKTRVTVRAHRDGREHLVSTVGAHHAPVE